MAFLGTVTKPSGLRDFSEAYSPYLQMAMQMMMQKKMEDTARQRAIEEMDIGKQVLTPQGEKYAASQLKTIEQGAPIQAEMPEIPEKLKKTVLDPSKMKPGMEVDMGGGSSWAAPQEQAYKPKSKEEQLVFEGEKQEVRIRAMQEGKAESIRSEMQAVDNMVDSVWKAAERLIPAPKDISQAEVAGTSRALKTASLLGWRPQRYFGISDENALAYDQITKGEASMVIRSLGEKGMLTDQDIRRAINLMPAFGDSKQLRDNKRVELRNFLKSKISAYSQNTGINIENVEEDFSQYSDDDLKAIAAGGQ